MARIIFPAQYQSQLTLLSNIIAENTALGAASPVIAYLAQMGIDLSADLEAGIAAGTHHTRRALLSKQSENFRQLRDNYFKLPWQVLTGSAQFLKQFYKNNTKELGNWGFTITDGGRMNYPPTFASRVAVFGVFSEKLGTFTPATNPLTPYFTQQDIDMEERAAQTAQAEDSNTNFIKCTQESENETQLRNQLWLPVLQHMKDIGNFLMQVYSNNPKALGNWGFVVDDSDKKPKVRTTKLKVGGKRTSKSVVMGSVVTHIAGDDLHVYKGGSATGTPVILHKGEQFGITKGWGTITVENPSTLAEGRFTWITNG